MKCPGADGDSQTNATIKTKEERYGDGREITMECYEFDDKHVAAKAAEREENEIWQKPGK